jgi:hypothetical protein
MFPASKDAVYDLIVDFNYPILETITTITLEKEYGGRFEERTP